LNKWEFDSVLECYILVDPKPKGRPRFARRGRFIQTYTPKETKDYEDLLRATLKEKWGQEPLPVEVPIGVDVTFHLKKPKSAKRHYPTVKPDTDNLLKAVLDALNGSVLIDDSSIVEIRSKKAYSSSEGFIELRVYSLYGMSKV
jgi:Holliday junction resolvase RusA-like endonuclease